MKPRRPRPVPPRSDEDEPARAAEDPYYAMLLQWLADDADRGDEDGFAPEETLRAERREGGST